MKVYAKCLTSSRCWWTEGKEYPAEVGRGKVGRGSSHKTFLCLQDNDGTNWDVADIGFAEFDFFLGDKRLTEKEALEKVTPGAVWCLSSERYYWTSGKRYTRCEGPNEVYNEPCFRDDDGDAWSLIEMLNGEAGATFSKENPDAGKEERTEEDPVYRPSHYTKWAVEPVEFLMRNRVEGWLFNVVKYAMRAGDKLYPGKDEIESEIIDLGKAKRYIDMRINLLKGEDEL